MSMLIEVQLLGSGVLLSAVWYSEAALDIDIHIYIPKEIYIFKKASKIAALYK